MVYTILFKAASETLADCARSRLGVQIGSTDILHTWGQNLMNHPHLHCIVTGGGLSQGKWISSKRRFLFPVKVLSPLFKGKFLFFLKKAYEAGELHGLAEDFTAFLSGLYAKDWVVDCRAPFNGPETVLGYLGRYTHRVAIANHRIIGMEDGLVSFFWKDYADRNTIKVMTLDAFEFIRRFLLHVLPDGFVKIRHYGLLSNRNRKACLEICRALLGVKEPDPAPSETWQESLCEDHRGRCDPVSSVPGADEAKGTGERTSMRGKVAMKMMNAAARDVVLDRYGILLSEESLCTSTSPAEEGSPPPCHLACFTHPAVTPGEVPLPRPSP